MHLGLGGHVGIIHRLEQIMHEQEGQFSADCQEFLDAQVRQARALQAERLAYAYAAEEYARARHHAAQVAQFAGVSQDLQGRVDHILFEGRAEIQALHTCASTQHQVIEMQEQQMNHFAECLGAERRGVRDRMRIAQTDIMNSFNQCES